MREKALRSCSSLALVVELKIGMVSSAFGYIGKENIQGELMQIIYSYYKMSIY